MDYRTALFTLTASVVMTTSAMANSVVTLCESDRQRGDGTNLAQAIQAGGLITFKCGDATIQMSGSHSIESDVRIDGEGRITLREGNEPMFLTQKDGVSLGLDNLKFNGTKRTIVQQRLATVPVTISGSVFTDCTAPINIPNGALTIKNSTFTNNTGNVVTAGATLTVDHTRFEGTKGVAIFSFGPDAAMRIVDSVFVNNSRGALLIGSGSASDANYAVEIVRTEFTNNGSDESTDAGASFGAALIGCNDTAKNCIVKVSGSTFSGNRAPSGGALSITGAKLVSVKNSRFDHNTAKDQGGAIFFDPKSAPDPTIQLQYLVFTSNSAREGGAVRILTSRLEARVVTFSKNTATESGGGLSMNGASVQMTRGVFVENSAPEGGAISLLGGGTSTIANTLIIRNRTAAGGAFSGASARFINVTIADNIGSGIHTHWAGGGRWGSGKIVLRNTIISKNSTMNCQLGSGPALQLPTSAARRIVNAGNNLEFPVNSCSATIPVADPSLDTLYLPVFGSPAAGTGHLATCLADPVSARDVYGKRRPQRSPSCSIGAAEGDLEQEIADQTVGGRRWPGGLDQGDKSKTGGTEGQPPDHPTCCCCRQ